MLEEYQPYFYGKDAIEKKTTWNALLSANDFAPLISDHEHTVAMYISKLRKAEIFQQCPLATSELNRLKMFISWEEHYTVNYKIWTTLSLPFETEEEFVAHAIGTDLSSELVVSEFSDVYGGDSFDWELISYLRSDSIPEDIRIHSLSLHSETVNECLTVIDPVN